MKKKAPQPMRRGSSVASRLDTSAYFLPRGSATVYKYESTENQWTELIACPNRDSALVMIDNQLTAIGGANENGVSDALYSYSSSARRWIKKFHEMPTARSQLAAVHHAHMASTFLLAAGGWNGENWTNVVEQLFIESNEWYKLTMLPSPVRGISAVIHGSDIFVVATDGSMYTCALRSFLLPKQKWILFPIPLPVWDSTLASFCNELIAIGGASVNMEAHFDVYQFFDNKWSSIGRLCKARWDCLVAVLPGSKAIVVGGGTAVDSDVMDVLAAY